MKSVPFQAVRDAYLAKRPGGLWFSRDAMKMFGTRLPRRAFPCCYGVYFVTSEMDFHGVVRRFTVRLQLPDGNIRQASDYLQFLTCAEAMAFISQRIGVAA